MLPSLIGIIASSGGVATSYESIATVTVGAGGASSITFSSIPSTYQHLQIRGIARSNRSGVSVDYAKVAFNSDSGANYSDHALYGNGGSALAQSATSANFIRLNRFAATTAGSNTFGAIVIDILDYANTSKYKTLRSLGGIDDNAGAVAEIWLCSGLWMNTSATNSVTITVGGGTNWTEYSSFALYGIKG